MKPLIASAALAIAMVAAPALAQNNRGEEDFATMMARINQLPDTAGNGPHPSMIEVAGALPDHVVYRPADFSKVRAGSLGVFVWGNGAAGQAERRSLLHRAIRGRMDNFRPHPPMPAN